MSIELKDKLVTLESLAAVYNSEVEDRNAAIAAETIARGEAIAAEVTARNAAIVEAINDAETGAPTKVELVSQMTDPDKNYLYIGEEAGYYSGHIYYLVDGEPVDKGVFGGVNIDDTLTIEGQAADAKATGDAIAQINEDLSAVEQAINELYGGVPSTVRAAIFALFDAAGWNDSANVTANLAIVAAWAAYTSAIILDQSAITISGASTVQLTATTTPAGNTVLWASSDTSVATVDSNGLVTGVSNGTATITATSGDIYATCTATVSGFAELVSISAAYTQSGTVYESDSLDDLTSDLVVTATYSDSTTETVTGYTLSGTLTAGTSTITVTYGGMTDTFDVTVTAPLWSWDFTQSLTDSKSGKIAELTASTGVSNPTRDSQGVHFTAAGQALMLFDENKSLADFANKTIQVDVASFVPESENDSFHVRFLMYNRPTIGWDSGVVFRQAASPNLGWNIYGDGGWGSPADWGSLTNRDDISGHTVTLYIDENLIPTLYIDSVLKGTQAIGVHETGCGLMIGNINSNPAAQGGTFYSAIVTGVRIYEGEVA